EHGDNFGALLFEPWWQQQRVTELVGRLVTRKPARGGRGALDQDSARAAAIDRMEVIAILDLRAIGIAEFFVEVFLLGQVFVRAGVERHVVAGSRAEGPASGGFVRFMNQDHGTIRAAGADLEAMEILLDTGLLESERVYEESFGLRSFTNR